MHGEDGSMLTRIAVPKGTNVLVGLRACNRNKALWGADAEEWKPERWLAPLPKAVEDAEIPGVYSHLYIVMLHIPSLEGTVHACESFKFARMAEMLISAMQWLHILPTGDEYVSCPTSSPMYQCFKCFLAELVLSRLLAHFTFERCATPIHWHISAVAFPSASKESLKPEMWLRVGQYAGDGAKP